MTGTASIRIYEVLHRHFKNDADAKVIIQDIETITDTDFAKRRIIYF